MNKIPITIITGFLGAGKTSFLEHILRENGGKKIAVIQNEFGEKIGLEEAMIVGRNSDTVMEWIEFPNGCLCCTAKDDMLIAMENLVKKNPSLDAILIELDGLADPEPVIRSLWADSELESSIYLDAVICVIDSVYFLSGYYISDKYHDEASRQIAYADIILLNKIDCIDKINYEKDILQLKSVLTRINPLAKQYQIIKGKISLDLVYNTNSFSLKEITHENNCEHSHDSDVKAITIEIIGSVKVQKVNQWLASLLWEQDTMTIYRIKGVLNIEGMEEKYNLQAVMSTFEIEPTNILWKDERRVNKIVIIGKNLDREFIDKKLKS